jgi:membrane protein DedA with SNARE-associated domain
MKFLDRFFDLLETLPDLLLYLALGLSAFVENVFPPIPGDTITAFGAFLVGTGRLAFLGVYLSTVLGSVLGFLCLFWLGRVFGRRFFIERDSRFYKARDIIRAEEWFFRHGYLLILLNRYLPGIRSVISIVGGISGLHALKVLWLAMISAGTWNLIWIWAGFMLGSNWEIVSRRMTYVLGRYNMAVFCLLGFLGLYLLVRRALRKRRSNT